MFVHKAVRLDTLSYLAGIGRQSGQVRRTGVSNKARMWIRAKG